MVLILVRQKIFLKELIGKRKRDVFFDVLCCDFNICNLQGINFVVIVFWNRVKKIGKFIGKEMIILM